MVDSRAKGARGEYLVRDMLREYTDLQFERVPSSGALEYLKGDLYVPHKKNVFCIEVKNYAESPLSDKMFTQKKTNNLVPGVQSCANKNSTFISRLNEQPSNHFSLHCRVQKWVPGPDDFFLNNFNFVQFLEDQFCTGRK